MRQLATGLFHGKRFGSQSVNSDTFVDWSMQFLISLVLWGLSYSGQHSAQFDLDSLIHLPTWLAVLAGRVSGDNLVPVRNFAWQMLAILVLLLGTLLAVFEPNHQKRVAWLSVGYIVFTAKKVTICQEVLHWVLPLHRP